MSGLQEITAIFAVVELGVKSLSAVYNLIQTLRHIPTRIEQAKHEVRDILNCLAGLRFIHTADRGTIHAINRAGLEASVSSCREACDQLRGLLSTWDPLQSSITAKLKYFRYRKAFDGLLNDITNRKQNTTLAVGITQLALQASSQQAAISHSQSLERFMAHCHPRHRMAEQNNANITGLPQHANRETSDLEVAGAQPVYDEVTDEQSSPSTVDSPLEFAYDDQVTPWAGEDGPAFAERKKTNTEGLKYKGHGAHVFEKVVNMVEKVAQVFEKGTYIDGGTKNKIGMPQTVAEAVINKNHPGVLQWFRGEARIGANSKGNIIGIFKD